MRNLEFKARLADPKAALTRARELGAELWGNLRQTDTYFDVPQGRLKLRETPGFQAELIYERDEASSERPSDYLVARSAEPGPLLAVLGASLAVRAVVRKRRTLLLLDTIRIHLDNVERLGDFLEIEVPVKEDEGVAVAQLDSLIQALGFRREDCIRASYVDLIAAIEAPSA